MERRSKARNAPEALEKPHGGPSPRRSIRSSTVIKNEERDVVNVPAKRNQLNGGSKIAVSHVQKPPPRDNNKSKQLNEKSDRVSDGKDAVNPEGDLLPSSSRESSPSYLQRIQMDHLRECSIVLKSVEIPETVYLDTKTKRRLSSLFKACRKSAKNPKRVSRGNSTSDVDSVETKPLSGQLGVKEESINGSAIDSKSQRRATIGKRKRVSEIDATVTARDKTRKLPETKETSTAHASNPRRRNQRSTESSATGSRGNPAKRRRVSAQGNVEDPVAEDGIKASRSKPNGKTSMNVDDIDKLSMCWDEIPEESSGKEREDLAGTSGSQNTSKSSDSDLALQRLGAPALSYFNDGERVPRNYFASPPTGRCAHCSCPCKMEDNTVDKNQPLITTFLKRASKKPRLDAQRDSNSATTESELAQIPTEKQRVICIESSPEATSERPGDDESIRSNSPPASKRTKSPKDLPTEITPREGLEESRDPDANVNVESSVAGDEECESSTEDLPGATNEKTVSLEVSTDGEVDSETPRGESDVVQDVPIVSEETCNESEKDRCSVSEVKLVLEESSDGSRGDEGDFIGDDAATSENKSGNADAGSEMVHPEIATDDAMETEEIEEANRDKETAVQDQSPAMSATSSETRKLEVGRTAETRAREVSASNEAAARLEATTGADPLLSQNKVPDTDAEEPMVTGSEAENVPADPNKSRVNSHNEKMELPMDPIVMGKDLEGGLKRNHDAKIEGKLTSESLLDTEEHFEPSREDCDECNEKPNPSVETPDRDQSDEISNATTAPSSGSEVLCFLGADTSKIREDGEDLGIATEMTPETSPENDARSKMDRGERQNDGIDDSGVVVQVLPAV